MLMEKSFHAFFTQIDNFKENTFLYLSTRGIPAVVTDKPIKRISYNTGTRNWGKQERAQLKEESSHAPESPTKQDD
jgi:hypothetical protein